MKKLNTIIMSGVMAMALTAYSAPAYAQDSEGGYMLIQQSNLHPTKSDDFKAAWETVLKHAKEQNYKYVTYVSKSGPRISMATEMTSYADIDAVMADRNRVYEAGGREFERAIEAMDAATHSTSSFVARHMPEISNPPTDEEMQGITMFEIAQIQIKPGHSDEFKDIMGKYKKGLADAGLGESSRYNVYAGGVGASGAYFFQSFADSDMDMAEQDAKINGMFKDSKAMQDLFADFQAIETSGSYADTTDWKMAKDLAYWPAE